VGDSPKFSIFVLLNLDARRGLFDFAKIRYRVRSYHSRCTTSI